MRQLLINIAKAVIALLASFITSLLNGAADRIVAEVQAKGDEVTLHNELADAAFEAAARIKAKAGRKTEAYIAAHVASVEPVKALRAEANRFQNLL
jgi:hypothetical protein